MKRLLLITFKFPFGDQETFLETEIRYLARSFDEIILYPKGVSSENDTRRSIPENVKVVINKRKGSHYPIFLFIADFCYSILKEKNLKTKFLYLYHVFSFYKYYGAEYTIYKFLRKEIDRLAEYLGYSYWFMEGCFALTLLKRKGSLSTCISRVHSYDLYDDRQGGTIPFRYLKAKYLNRIICISNDGLKYLSRRIPFSNKLVLSYLGTQNYGFRTEILKQNSFTMVSCSNIIPIKRVELIALALSLVSLEIKWVHFGDGPYLSKVMEAVSKLPENITFEFKGRVPNPDIFDFYRNHDVHLFINVSELEGLPVSIMEAISFGIPVLATDVGGTSELVNVVTGVLVDKNILKTQLSQSIESMLLEGNFDPHAIRAFWNKNFNCETNYASMVTELINLQLFD